MKFPYWGCNNNIREEINLVSGDSWENDLDMATNELLPDGKVSLRFGFSPIYKMVAENGNDMSPPNPDHRIYWSNKVTIEVIP
jgi:hypothetical protein